MNNKILRHLSIVFLDVLVIVVSGVIALLARYDFSFSAIPDKFSDLWLHFLPIQIVVTLGVFAAFRMYNFVWRSVSIHDVEKIVISVFTAYILNYIISLIFNLELPNSVDFIMLLCELFLFVGMRCSMRFYVVVQSSIEAFHNKNQNRIMIVGAGDAGHVLIREIANSVKINSKVVCVIDDNPVKWGHRLENIPIVGGRDKIISTAGELQISEIIFAIPTATAKEKREILDICSQTGCSVKVVPGIYQLINGEVNIVSLKNVQIEDLLGRDPVQLDTASLDNFLGGKVVLVTGGGGSIGSELCRQIVKYNPRQLVIIDIYENNAYDIQQELIRNYGNRLNLAVEIASVRDKEKIYDLFNYYRPDIVFHAAAHKHVPLMENCPEEAIKNNIFGTYNVVMAAEKYCASKFVMISTDKAVNPTNIMGATKRFCEMILQSRFGSKTEFAAVRFGNVLGSNGSVVPLFKRQIEEGGPVTITDKRIIRYFMTIPEAAQLVLQAGSMAKQSQIFVLDMGEPVKILTLAENLIRLSGLEPYKDIEIREIGLRPGEKLYEELLMRSESLTKTDNSKIFIEQQRTISPDEISAALSELDKAVTGKFPDAQLISLMKSLIPTYKDPMQVNAQAASTQEMAEAK